MKRRSARGKEGLLTRRLNGVRRVGRETLLAATALICSLCAATDVIQSRSRLRVDYRSRVYVSRAERRVYAMEDCSYNPIVNEISMKI